MGILHTGSGGPGGCMNSDMYHHASGKQGMLPGSHDSLIPRVLTYLEMSLKIFLLLLLHWN
jgi:hypothetical protein